MTEVIRFVSSRVPSVLYTLPVLAFLLCLKFLYDLRSCVTWTLLADLHQTKSFAHLTEDTVG